MLLTLLFLSNFALAEGIDWEAEEMLGNVFKGELGKVDDLTINYQKVDRPSLGHNETGVKLNWTHPTKKDCCVAFLFNEATDGMDALTLTDGVVRLDLTYNPRTADGDVRKLAKSHCWKLNKDKTEFTELKQCPAKKKSKKS